jgi:hypothetical protein
MQINGQPPFELSEADGASCAVRGDLQISVLADAGEVAMCHRVAKNPVGGTIRWLMIDLKDHGLRVYVSGGSVVVSAADFSPEFFALPSADDLVNQVLERIEIAEVEFVNVHGKKRRKPNVDTERNREMFAKLVELVTSRERSRLLAEARYGVLKGIDK